MKNDKNLQNLRNKNTLVTSSILEVITENISMTIGIFLVVLVAVAISLIPPQILKIIIDSHFLKKDFNGVLLLTVFYVSIQFLIGFFDFVKGYLLIIFGQKIVYELRAKLFSKLDRLKVSYFTKTPAAVITSRITTDVESINELFTNGLAGMCIDCLKIIGIIISISIFSFKLTIIAFIIIPIVFLITRHFQKGMLSSQVKNLEQLSKVNNHIAETMKNIQMIKVFHREGYLQGKYADRLRDNYITKERVNFYDSCYAPIIQTIKAITIATIVILASGRLNLLGLTIGMVAASIELMTNLLLPIESLGMEIQNIQQGISGIKRVNDFYREEEEEEKDQSLTAAKIIGVNGIKNIQFNHVSFYYVEDQPVISNLNLVIEGNSNVVFVGRTGIGKTTLFNLILGLLKPTSGQILINNYDTSRIPNHEKRKIFGYVEQNFSFVQGDVYQQITLGCKEITNSQVEEACKFVGIDEYISQMQNGYSTIITNGNEFSWGQRQLLAIARAIVFKPEILLLDEITANLDSATEEKVVAVLKKASERRTILSISHRMATILESERIINLE